MITKILCRFVVGIGLIGMVACVQIATPATNSSQNGESIHLESSVEPTLSGAVENETPQIAVTSKPTETGTEETVSSDPINPDPQSSPNQQIAALAVADLSRRLAIPAEQIEVREVREVIWPDASLGCPQPGMVYAQVTQDGLLIRLGVGTEMYFYHSGGNLDPFLCEQTSEMFPKVIPKPDEMVPPPDWEID